MSVQADFASSIALWSEEDSGRKLGRKPRTDNYFTVKSGTATAPT